MFGFFGNVVVVVRVRIQRLLEILMFFKLKFRSNRQQSPGLKSSAHYSLFHQSPLTARHLSVITTDDRTMRLHFDSEIAEALAIIASMG
ncbi:hypothetical protein C5167_048254 [Papaver somniferum]|uniref:Uncharacterized protein n=1 Tax=Papaver somniferum TaxID=3469 RepID=A0A4Y7KIT6_PAPSO|nr:hypothetical protein C5167_048254 [Papaver somniferum]